MESKETIAAGIPPFLTSLGYIAIPFRQNAAGQLIIQAMINGIDGAYILDTGAGQTVVDSKQAEKLNLTVNHADVVLTGGGVGAHGLENIPSYNNSIAISNFKMENLTVAVMSLETAWQSLASVGANDELYGIIGFDVLKAGNALIDYGTMTLYLL